MTVHSPQASFIAAPEQDESWRTYYELVRRWWWLLIAASLVAGLLAWGVSSLQTPIYRTTAKLLINQATGANANVVQDILTSERVAQTYATWMGQKAFVDATVAQLALNQDPERIGEQITSVIATPLRNSQIIELAVEGPTRELIVAFARLLPQVFSREVQKIQTSRYAETKNSLNSRLEDLNRQIETTQNALNLLNGPRTSQQELEYTRLSEDLSRLRTAYNSLAATYEQVLLYEAQSVDTIAVIEEAVLPDGPIRPNTLRNILLALILGAGTAFGLLLLYEMATDRFRSNDDIRQVLGLPVLGSIGQIGVAEDQSPDTLVSLQDPRALSVEAFRRLRTNLRFANVDVALKGLAVTSANPGEGKSLISSNLAVVMAQSGLTVILVDADLRKPRQHRLFGVARSPGLTDALLGENFDQLDLLLQPTRVLGLRVLTAGNQAPNPAELLGSRRMAQMADLLKSQADMVIFDTPPVLAVTDAQITGAEADGTLLVLDIKRTTRKAARYAVELLDQVGARVVGLAINRLTSNDRGYYYSYYDYEYYHEDGDDTGASGNGAGGERRKHRSRRHAQHSGVQQA